MVIIIEKRYPDFPTQKRKEREFQGKETKNTKERKS